MKRATPAVMLTFLALSPIACERQPSTPAPEKATGTPSATPAPSEAKPAAPAPSATGGATISALGVRFAVPDGWKEVPPANQMRLAELVVADASGDAAKACSVVFSTAGGDVQANVTRWAGQMRDSAGQAPKFEITTREIEGLKVHMVEFRGLYQGMGDGTPKPDWMMRGGIVETSSGLLFVKMTGPAATMQGAEAGWASLINSARKL